MKKRVILGSVTPSSAFQGSPQLKPGPHIAWLNDWLRLEGGHIGYGVLPGHRRRGYATEILRQSLVVARAHGVDRVLVTCDDDNAGSAAVIEANGGVLDPELPLTGADG